MRTRSALLGSCGAIPEAARLPRPRPATGRSGRRQAWGRGAAEPCRGDREPRLLGHGRAERRAGCRDDGAVAGPARLRRREQRLRGEHGACRDPSGGGRARASRVRAARRVRHRGGAVAGAARLARPGAHAGGGRGPRRAERGVRERVHGRHDGPRRDARAAGRALDGGADVRRRPDPAARGRAPAVRRQRGRGGARGGLRAGRRGREAPLRGQAPGWGPDAAKVEKAFVRRSGSPASRSRSSRSPASASASRR